MSKLLNYKLLLLAFVLSSLLTYSYYDFKYNMSIGVGHAYTAKSLALSHNFNVDEYWGNAGVDVIDSGGHKYTAYAPLNAVIMSVPYFGLQSLYFLYTHLVGAVNGDVSIVLESLALKLPSTLFYVLLGLLLVRLLGKYKVDDKKRTLVLAGFLWGTIFFNYSVSFFNHITAAFFIFSAYYFIDKSTAKRNYFIAGIFTGLAFLTEYPAILFSIAIFIHTTYLLYLRKMGIRTWLCRLAYFAFPVAISVLLLGLFNWMHFGSLFMFSEHILFIQKSRLGVEHTFSQNPIYGIWGLYLSPLKGLFLISPFLLFAIPGYFKFLKVNKPMAVLGLSYIVLISTVYSMWPDCFGATPFGPRYLITVIPFLSFYSGFGIDNKWSYRVCFMLVLYGIYICFMNLVDGLPSGTWFDVRRCRVWDYGSLFKANSYFKSVLNGKFRSAPILLR